MNDALALQLSAHSEWLCAESDASASAVALTTRDFELIVKHDQLHFSYMTAQGGWIVWRVTDWRMADGKVLLDVERRMGAVRTTLGLTPRVTARDVNLEIEALRRRACAELARLAASHIRGGQIEKIALSRGARRSEPGRYARILIAGHNKRRIAVTGAVAEVKPQEVERMMASALLWFVKLRRPARELWIIIPTSLIGRTIKCCALLKESLRTQIVIYEHATTEHKTPADETAAEVRNEPHDKASDKTDNEACKEFDNEARSRTDDESNALEAHRFLLPVAARTLKQLLTDTKTETRRAAHFAYQSLSDTAQRIIAFAPDAIDAVRARHGETLRFHGLAFARVRRFGENETVWFGIEAKRRLLDENSWRGLAEIIDKLAEYRRDDTPDRQHRFYAAAPEAWLETILRRDISRLDPGLVVSPLHAQFRVRGQASDQEALQRAARPLDLLALRRDGRLVVIELKTTETLALPLQAAGYWLDVEAARLDGSIARRQLFGGTREIADAETLVYLVAPALRFHRQTQELARLLAPEIEVFRFDLNEDWRAGVRVSRRQRINE